MIRKMLLPVLAVAMLAGCASYQYRGGAGGDYYYGQPSTDYRYYGNPYGAYGYGYPYGGWGGSIGYGFGYYSSPYYRPYYRDYGYPRYPRRPWHGGNGHGGGHTPGQPPRDGGNGRPPWRNLGDLGDAPRTGQRSAPVVRQRSSVAPMERTAPTIRRSAPTIRTAPKQQPRANRDAGPTP